jgi:CBS domain-containing protein
MRIAQLQHSTVPEVRPGDAFHTVREMMMDVRLFDLPVVDTMGVFLGVIQVEQIQERRSGTISQLPEGSLSSVFMDEEDLLGRLLRLMRTKNMGIMPICNPLGEYRFCITSNDLLNWVEGESMLAQPGAVMSLRMATHDYSLAKLARIAESNRAMILNLRMHDDEQPGMCLVHLKFNLMDLSQLLSGYEHFGYEIVYVSHETRRDEWLRDRYSSLMRYLEI